ncbi:MAG: hypothetical protein QXG73_00990 [Candidatus Micrarchaeaceae archaeon]
MDKKDKYFFTATMLLLVFILSVQMIYLTGLATTPSILILASENYGFPFFLIGFLITIFVIPLAYFGYKSRLRLIRYTSIFLLVFTFATWLSPFALPLAVCGIIAYDIMVFVFSKRNKNNGALLHSELFGGIINLSIAVPFFIMFLSSLFLPLCSAVGPSSGACRGSLNIRSLNIFLVIITIIIVTIMGVVTLDGTLMLVQSISKLRILNAYSRLKTYAANKPEQYEAIQPNRVNTAKSTSKFVYIPIEIKAGLLIAFFFAVLGAMVLILLILLSLGISIGILSALSVFSPISSLRAIGSLAVTFLMVVILLDFYLMLRIAKMWNAANSGNKERLKELNSSFWAIIATLSVFLTPAGIILLIMHAPINNIKRGLSSADLDKLIKLKKLLDNKVITKKEYNAEKKRTLSGLRDN